MAVARSIVLISFIFTILTTSNANRNLDILGSPTPTSSHGHKGGHGGVVVALDGSGDYRSIKEAVNAARGRGDDGGRFEIYVKKGRYNEYVQIPEDAKDITLIGEGIGNTIIVGNKHAGQSGVSTYNSATFMILGDGFIAKGITFQNTAGPNAGQAVVVTSNADRLAFYQCSFEGYQDTLYLSHGKQFFKECDIYGSMDMICGDATALFQTCNIYLRPHNGSQVLVTAQKRESQNDPSGFVIQDSRVLRTDELKRDNGVKVFLGRPWGRFARTVYVNNYFDGVDPLGWEGMGGNTDGKDVYYAEFGNSGEGSDMKGRVKWSGVHQIDENEAAEFTVRRFLDGETWLDGTGVPYK